MALGRGPGGLLAGIGLVLVAELLNTAIEALADRLHPERHPEIRVVKDVAAAAVEEEGWVLDAPFGIRQDRP